MTPTPNLELISKLKIEDKQIRTNLSELIHIVHSYSSVHRYSNKTVLKDENVAEHSSIVGIIVLFIYENLEEELRNQIDLNRLLAFCIFHDFDEIFSGDMINPVKYFNDAITKAINEYTKQCIEKFSQDSGMKLIPYYADTANLPAVEYSILKMADIFSVFIKFQIENGLGNRMLNVDYNNIISGLNSKKICDQVKSDANVKAIIKVISSVCSTMNDNRVAFSNILSLDHS